MLSDNCLHRWWLLLSEGVTGLGSGIYDGKFLFSGSLQETGHSDLRQTCSANDGRFFEANLR